MYSPHDLRLDLVSLREPRPLEFIRTIDAHRAADREGQPTPYRSPNPAPSLCDMVRSCPGAMDFSAVSAMAWAELERAAQRRRYEHNGFIYLQDDAATHLYFVVSGYVRISSLLEDGTAVLHAILPSGESFGELGVFEESTYCDMATAIGPSVIAAIPIPILRTLGERHPEVRDALARAVARRYRGYVMLTRDLSLKTLAARLAQAVLRLAGQLGTRTPFQGRPVRAIASLVTQSDLGLMARGSRGNVNRVLKTWERAGWIALVDRCILILDQGRLESLAMEDC